MHLINEEKALALIKKFSSLNNITSAHLSSIIKSTAEQILRLDESIKTEKANLLDRFKNEADAVLLTSITGAGEQSAVEILIEIEDVNRFESAKKPGAYFGTYPMYK